MAMIPLSSEIKVRSRSLPHWTRRGAVYWVTFRLADSLPQEKVIRLKAAGEEWFMQHPQPWSSEVRAEYATRFTQQVHAWLDAGYGSCSLALPEVRQHVQACLLRFDDVRLSVHAAVIMPNHVHVLLEPKGEHQLSALLKGIKGTSARLVNKELGRLGVFWMDESYDHIVRSEKEYAYFLRYIRENPIKAHLKEGEYWLYFMESLRER